MMTYRVPNPYITYVVKEMRLSFALALALSLTLYRKRFRQLSRSWKLFCVICNHVKHSVHIYRLINDSLLDQALLSIAGSAASLLP